MPKIVDHERRRDEIALIACRVVAQHGFEQATIVRIARAAGCTTGMIAHYFDTKQDIIVAALRLILRRIEQRLTHADGAADLLTLLSEALPIDETRYMECAVWMAFWGQVPADRRLKRVNAWLHHEYLRLFERCLARGWGEWRRWPARSRDQLLRSVITFINGVTASTVASRAEWPAARSDEQRRRHRRGAWAPSRGDIGPRGVIPRRGIQLSAAYAARSYRWTSP